MKKVKKSELKELVNQVAPKMPESVVFLAGAKAIKDGQVQFEFVQSRNLGGRKTSLVALLNEGDKRFNSGRTTMRVWLMANETGFKTVFGEVKDLDTKEVFADAKTTGEDEVIVVAKMIESILVNGIKQPLMIVCKETVDPEKLPKSIRDQIKDPEVSQKIKDRYILQTGGEKSQMILDPHGNIIYRRYELSYGNDQDVLILDKILASDLVKNKSSESAESLLNTMAGTLAE